MPTVFLSKHFAHHDANDLDVVKMVPTIGEELGELRVTSRVEQMTYEQLGLRLSHEWGLLPRYGEGKLVSPGNMNALFFHG